MIDDFIKQPEVLKTLDRVKNLRASGKRFSDIEDSQGNQYVDLVQEGGGVLGVALAGYTYVLEEAGIRFFRLAGTSAGAINTMLLAALGKIEEPKSEKILAILGDKNLFDLVDGNPFIRTIIRKAVQGEKIGWNILFNAVNIYKTITKQLGLNPGNNFSKWMEGLLNEVGIRTLGELKQLRSQLPALKNTTGGDLTNLEAQLAIITSDITTHSKIEFPKMASLYWRFPDEVHPAVLVRASMSIPFFFEPLQVNAIPNAGNIEDPVWDGFTRYNGPVPPSVKFVDGGLLSNFPINVFHRPNAGVPRMPTFGVRLSTYRENFSASNTLTGFAGAMVSTMRQIHDYDFLLKNPDYKQLICKIDADRKFNWLDFNMPRQKQVELFVLGATRAIDFLEVFDWEKYKDFRKADFHWK